MKRQNLHTTAIVTALIVSFMSTGCLGRFAAFNKISDWNQRATDDKYLNEIIFLAFNIIPVYGVALLADAVVFNSIEFWGGQNPIRSEGEYQKTVQSGDFKAVQDFRQNGEVKTVETRYYFKDRLVNTLTLSKRTGFVELNGTSMTSGGEALKFRVRADGNGLLVTRTNPEGQPISEMVGGSAFQALSASVAALINPSTLQLASAH